MKSTNLLFVKICFAVGVIATVILFFEHDSQKAIHARAVSACNESNLKLQLAIKTARTLIQCDPGMIYFMKSEDKTFEQIRVYDTQPDARWTDTVFLWWAWLVAISVLPIAIPFCWRFTLKRIAELSRAVRGID